MTDHGAMVMANDMAGMAASLHGKSGDDFDRAFLAAMVQHHQSAVAMSRPAAANAAYQEVKDLASGIAAQTTEIGRMQGWQRQRGYGSK
jgi:uncharacterized protein (DUF305 family)